MCGPAAIPLAISAAGAAASAVGSYSNANNQQAQLAATQRRRNQEAEAERIRQRAFQDEASAEMARVLPQVANPQTLADAIGMRTAAAEQVTRAPAAGEYRPTPQSAPAVVTNEVDRQRSKGAKRASSTATAKAKLSAYGDQQAGNSLAMTGAARRIAGITDASRGSAAILPLAQQAVVNNANRNQPAITFGDVLGLAGQGAQMYGFMGAPGLNAPGGTIPLNKAGFRATGAGPMASRAF